MKQRKIVLLVLYIASIIYLVFMFSSCAISPRTTWTFTPKADSIRRADTTIKHFLK